MCPALVSSKEKRKFELRATGPTKGGWILQRDVVDEWLFVSLLQASLIADELSARS